MVYLEVNKDMVGEGIGGRRKVTVELPASWEGINQV